MKQGISALFTGLLLLATLVIGVEILALNPHARLAPLWAIIPTLVLLLVQLCLELWPGFAREARQIVLRSAANDKIVERLEMAAPAGSQANAERSVARECEAFAWLALLLIAVLAFSLDWGVAAFLLCYLLVRTSLPVWRSGLLALMIFVFLHVGFTQLGTALPLGWVQRLLAHL